MKRYTKYKVLVNNKVVGYSDSAKKHGDIIDIGDEKFFTYYTKGASIFAGEHIKK